uniref:TLC domain-containing protein n=1 Tax=Odontella aurita TaxID=265563 RepID=A0A7S4NBQ1_9STRA|mmetsp:Transcript_56404/g.168819  ORF Transcript_56404/g.168819 Transcript_56404/m.168819 type:complete len:335 (+) Transcript_56404:208-1212(+)
MCASARVLNEKGDDGDDSARAPLILRPWIHARRSVPKCIFPGTKDLDVSIIFIGAVALNALRLSFLRLLLHLGWPGESSDAEKSGGWDMTCEAAGSLTAIVHSLCIITGVAACLLSQPYSPSARMDESPRWWRDAADALLQLCTGYMVYDALVLLLDENWDADLGRPVLAKSDWLFVAHHIATAVYMTTARLVGAGHQSAMMLMCMGEATCPLMNAHMILRLAVRLRCCSGTLALELLKYVEFAFAGSYCFFRIAVGPVVAAHLTYDLIFTRKGRWNVPLWLSILVWMPMCWGVLFGSIPWIKDTSGMLRDGLANVKYGPEYDWGDRYGYYDEL